MSAQKQLALVEPVPMDRGISAIGQPNLPAPPQKATAAATGPIPVRTPTLRLVPLVPVHPEKRFVKVPTHAVGVCHEQREHPRATMSLPLKLRSVENQPEVFPITLVTRDISSTGAFFLCPKHIARGTAIELEIVLVSRPMGRGNVVIATLAHVCRIEPAAMPGWFGIAVTFDDVQFDRDDTVPTRYQYI